VRVLIAGGGTGGHLYPGIAVARALVRRDPATEVRFVGTAAGIEARVVPREGFSLEVIRVSGLKGTSFVKRLRGLLLLPLAAVDAWHVVSRFRPDVVVGVGGFASGPVLALSALRGRPTLLLEQNAQPGVTNRLLAPFVRAAAVNFEAALRFFPRTGFVAGNPVRPEFFRADAGGGTSESADEEGGQVLIVGGSLGAHAINVAMVAAAPRLAAAGLRLRITHQTGARDLPLVREAYAQAGIEARADAFLYDIDQVMARADVIVCRAGATTLAELAAVGRPSILVPFPKATDDHQRKNALVFEAAGAAVMLEERDLDGQRLADTLAGLLGDRERRRRMTGAARSLARADAAERVAERVEQLGGRHAG